MNLASLFRLLGNSRRGSRLLFHYQLFLPIVSPKVDLFVLTGGVSNCILFRCFMSHMFAVFFALHYFAIALSLYSLPPPLHLFSQLIKVLTAVHIL